MSFFLCVCLTQRYYLIGLDTNRPFSSELCDAVQCTKTAVLWSVVGKCMGAISVSTRDMFADYRDVHMPLHVSVSVS